MFKKMVLVIIALSIVGYVALSARAPREFALQTTLLDEASGIAASSLNPGIIWSHNDSGGKPAVYALDSEGKLRAILELQGTKNRDWEDIAISIDPTNGKSYLYIGEIGDNGARYSSIKVLRVEEPSLKGADSLLTSNKFQEIEINYEDGPRDAEALFIEPHSQDIYIISKREEKVGLYRVAQPFSAEINIAKKISTLPLTWVTAADISPNGKYILVKTYTGIWRFKNKPDKQGVVLLNNKPKALPYHLEPQGEGLCYTAKGKGYYTLSEASEDSAQLLYFYK